MKTGMGCFNKLVNFFSDEKKSQNVFNNIYVEDIKKLSYVLLAFSNNNPRMDRYTEGYILFNDGQAIGYINFDIRTRYIINIEINVENNKEEVYTNLLNIARNKNYLNLQIPKYDDMKVKILSKCNCTKTHEDLFMCYMVIK